ncbi:MAG: hypothetical protein GY786_21545 [Proteobacteria bacterium]|nr:hypothetical protein [Pseudomonadota bacterium]
MLKPHTFKFSSWLVIFISSTLLACATIDTLSEDLAKELGLQEIKKIELDVKTEILPTGLLVEFETKDEWQIYLATLSLICPKGRRTVTFSTSTSNSTLVRNKLSNIHSFPIESCKLSMTLRSNSQEQEFKIPYQVVIPINWEPAK